MKHLPCIFMALELLALSCSGGRDNNVLVVEKMKSYHRASCAKLNMAETIRMSPDSARAKRIQPCPYCRPEKL